jgi:hypothetical protein
MCDSMRPALAASKKLDALPRPWERGQFNREYQWLLVPPIGDAKAPRLDAVRRLLRFLDDHGLSFRL